MADAVADPVALPIAPCPDCGRNVAPYVARRCQHGVERFYKCRSHILLVLVDAINNGHCWKETKNRKFVCACSNEQAKGCKCPQGFKSDGVHGCKGIAHTNIDLQPCGQYCSMFACAYVLRQYKHCFLEYFLALFVFHNWFKTDICGWGNDRNSPYV